MNNHRRITRSFSPHLIFAWALICSLLAGQAQTLDQQVEVMQGLSVSYPNNWSASKARYRNAVELVSQTEAQNDQIPQGRILITTERRRSHDEAIKRLEEITLEVTSPVTFLEVSGWPAMQRRYMAPLQRRGIEAASQSEALAPRLTTAIAVGDLLIRLDGMFVPGADASLVAQAEAIGRSMRATARGNPTQLQRDLRLLRGRVRPAVRSSVRPPSTLPTRGSDLRRSSASLSALAGVDAAPGAAVLVQAGRGELEVAVSNNGQNVVVAANSGFSFSNDGGVTFNFGGDTPAVSNIGGRLVAFPADGDPSLAVGASGTFYYGFIGFPNGTPAANNVTGCSTGISVSTNNGQAFTFRGHAVLCPRVGMNICFPDQEHIAADRVNAAPAGDQVYSVWRNFTPAAMAPSCDAINLGFVTPSIVCSNNGGTNWTAPAVIGNGDFPRVTVGRDGSVYVVYLSGANLMLNRFSSCANGLVQQMGFPVTVATGVNGVLCPVPGLDRCNDGNTLASPMVAVDDTNANHLYIAYADNTSANNENIIVRDSTDGGQTWPRAITVNTVTNGRRFMPWVCSAGGTAHVSWYDRRAALRQVPAPAGCLRQCDERRLRCFESRGPDGRPTPAQCAAGFRNCRQACLSPRLSNDLTDYFVRDVSVQGGNLQLGSEMNLSVNPDPQCASGWPCGARSNADFLSCSVQPQAGAAVDGGCPKYGDYNGNACAAGRAYIAWASATSPPGVPAVPGIRLFFSTFPQQPPPQLTIQKVLIPATDPGRFNLQIDGATRAPNVGHQGATGPLTLSAGPHRVGESAGLGTSIANYTMVIGGDCAPDGTITLMPGDNKTCTITNRRRSGGPSRADCLEACEQQRDRCMERINQRGNPTAAQCMQAYRRCQSRCPPR